MQQYDIQTGASPTAVPVAVSGGVPRLLARASVVIPRISLGIIFLWFGALKLVVGLSPAEDLAGRTLTSLTFHLIPAEPLVRVLGGVECAIGVCFICGFFMRATLIAFFVHMLGTFTALILCPSECFGAGPLALTLIGQYVMKNLVLVAAGIGIAPSVFARSLRTAPPPLHESPAAFPA